ncbi:uncharacterized protein LOC142257600 [Anomaloglossus baeobatrachus]|uniref:uncharacterized protein LOC142257600 n=1 Tax=Anomaloglossus baeobatrachus TaxID=238106 RepID=UPI003F5037A3
MAVGKLSLAEPQHNVSGDLHSPLNLTTSFSSNDLKEVSWKFEINGTENLIATIRNGRFVDDHNGYSQYDNGAVLEIDNLTKDHQGIYIADVTFPNNTVKTMCFNLTVHGNLAPAEKEPTTSSPSSYAQSEGLPTNFGNLTPSERELTTSYPTTSSQPELLPTSPGNLTPSEREPTTSYPTTSSQPELLPTSPDNMNTLNHLSIVVFLVTAVVVAVILVTLVLVICRKCRKRASYRTHKGRQEPIQMWEEYKSNEQEREEHEREEHLELSGNHDEQIQSSKKRKNYEHQNGHISVKDQIEMEEHSNEDHENEGDQDEQVETQRLKECDTDVYQNGDIRKSTL